MTRKFELYGGKFDGKPIELNQYSHEILIPDLDIDLMYELEYGDPTQPFEMKTVSYRMDKDGRYSSLKENK